MNAYGILLFLHVSGAILIFIGIATLIFGVAALRLATTVEQVRAIARPMVVGRKIGLEQISVIDAVTIIGAVMTGATGLYMALDWGFWRGWIEAAIVSFALIAPVGPLVINPRLHAIASTADATPHGPIDASLFSRTHDSLLTAALLTITAWLLGVVFLMTAKPSLVTSIIAMLVAMVIGLAASLLLWRVGMAGRDRTSPKMHSPGRR